MYNEIMSAIQKSWENCQTPHIAFVVTNDDGSYNENITFPIGQDRAIAETNQRMVLINLGLNACKGFYYDEERGDFVYDVGVNGTKFLGNIPVGVVLYVVDVDSGQMIWCPDTEVSPKPNPMKLSFKLPTFKRPNATADVKKVGLSLASYTENPQPSSTYKKWTPRLV